MIAETPCPKCGSKDCIPDARMIDHSGAHSVACDLSVGVYRWPSALLLKGQVMTSLRAKVCARCGFTELFASDPQTLYETWLAARSSQ